jgi:hypothetical protein
MVKVAIFMRVVLQILLLLVFTVLIGGVRGRKREGSSNLKLPLKNIPPAPSGDKFSK